MSSSERCYLLLEDGRRFDGDGFGAIQPALGEVVFNTAMTGYQEILTDPSYSGQLVVMTSPQIGNYGVTPEDEESSRPMAAGFIVRELARRPSSWRSTEGLDSYLERHEIPALTEVDTRALTRHIRSSGAMRGGIFPGSIPESDAMAQILASPRMEGLDLACGVSTKEEYIVEAHGDPQFDVYAYDLGVKAHSPRLLAERGCRVHVVPAVMSAEEMLERAPDGLFVSNGPGDPAAVDACADTIRLLANRGVPVFGICLGNQLIARAFGGTTYKLPFGHHGANHPVRNLDVGSVEITSQNHGFAVRGGPDRTVTDAPDLRVTHLNLYDQTVEGIEHRELPAFAVQYHPEAAPGPHDSRYLFDRFVEMMADS
jgi:carbamoyl-phosphate synthase small subunit